MFEILYQYNIRPLFTYLPLHNSNIKMERLYLVEGEDVFVFLAQDIDLSSHHLEKHSEGSMS